MADAAGSENDNSRDGAKAADTQSHAGSNQSLLFSFPTISASAFLIGATTATIISLRRGRIAAARERLARASASASSSSNLVDPSSSSTGGAIGAATKGPLALFSELNSVAFKKGSSSETQQPTTTASAGLPASLSAKARGKLPASRDAPPPPPPAAASAKSNVPEGPGARDMWSAFDAPTGAPPPSVLMRKRPPTSTTPKMPERASKDGPMTALRSAPSSSKAAAIPAALLATKQTSQPRPQDGLAAAVAPLSSDPAPSMRNLMGGGGGLFLDKEWEDEDEAYYQSQQGEEEPPANESFWTSPFALAVGAFTVATALVGCTAFVAVQVAKSVIGFKTTDEFVQRMADLVPSRNTTSEALRLPKPAAEYRDGEHHAVAVLEGDEDLYKAWDESFSTPADSQSTPLPPPVVMPTDADGNATTPLAAAMARLEAARTPAEWWEMLKDQLDAEREEDVRARRERVAASSLPSSSTSR
ncbi:hypothetical protein OC846_001019 [Tilletia horrida]|uniref:Uncharacterized protein n=1 Tax=Tilletia horrida TaxID=155126 RepID=A0AAN6GWP5_9BASI|nr:hypothetical protein OC846_001019 [Tilletia horrida]